MVNKNPRYSLRATGINFRKKFNDGVLIDYGIGNLYSLAKAIASVGGDVKISGEQIKNSAHGLKFD
ncbi:MAG: hypothetical protein K6G55_03665 [Selenomonadaceae bacterium]|nr:hypothetical protein [Selenomonadaceae bacterium]